MTLGFLVWRLGFAARLPTFGDVHKTGRPILGSERARDLRRMVRVTNRKLQDTNCFFAWTMIVAFVNLRIR
jgi:hypothetical protein